MGMKARVFFFASKSVRKRNYLFGNVKRETNKRFRMENDTFVVHRYDKNVNFTDLHKHCSETLKLGVKRIVLSPGNSSLFTGAANRISSLLVATCFN